MKDRLLKILYMYPKGVKLSLVGLIMLFITGSSFYMVFKFPFYTRLKVIFVLLFVVNALLFVRFRNRKKSFFHRMMQSRFFPRKLAFTMEGKFLVFITLSIGFAAVNTGINLLYLLMAMLLSIIVTSGILSELTLRKLCWEVDIPSETIISSETNGFIKIQNKKRYLSSFSLEGDLLVAEDSGIIQKKGILLKLKAGEESQMLVRLVFPKRGKHQIRGISIGTRFPFSFFSKSRHYEFNRSVLVMPKGEESVEKTLSRLSIKQDDHFDARNKKGQGSEFFSIRQMHSGDDWRNVHWKKTASRQQFAIKEFEEMAGKRALICLTGSQRDHMVHKNREQGIEIVASIVRLLVHRNFHVSLVAPNLYIDEGEGPSSIKRIFIALALLDADQDFRISVSQRNRGFSDTLISVNLDTLEVSQMNDLPGPGRRYQIPAGGDGVL